MKFKSELVTAASGSIGGATYLQGHAGMIRQAKPLPSNTSSPLQRTIRASFQAIAIAWRNDLTQSQRDAWSNYASLTPITGAFGDALMLSGSQMFLRCNATRRAAGLDDVLNGPTTPGLALLSAVSFRIGIGSLQLDFLFNNSDPWANEIGGALLIKTTRFLAQARKFSRGKERVLVSILGNPAPPFSPVSKEFNAFGQDATIVPPELHMSASFVAIRSDGRISRVQSDFGSLVPA